LDDWRSWSSHRMVSKILMSSSLHLGEANLEDGVEQE
jgi:hypothetical protein